MLAQFSSGQFIENFLEQMLVDAGMDDFTPDVKEQMIRDLGKRLEERFFAAVLQSLDENKLTQFREMLEAQISQAELEKFLNDSLTNPSELFAQAMVKFRQDYLGITA